MKNKYICNFRIDLKNPVKFSPSLSSRAASPRIPIKIGLNRRIRIKAGLLGGPLNKSMSPLLFKLFSGVTGEDYDYALKENRGRGLENLLKLIKKEGWAGFNVTLPLKGKIIPLLTSMTPEARAVGAVNAVRINGEKLIGHNTDAQAFLYALRGSKAPVKGRVCAVWGSGGAARAALWALAVKGAGELHIHARSSVRARSLSRHFKKIFPDTVFKVKDFGVLPDQAAAVFVNATPLGMYKPLNRALKFNGPAGALYCDFAYARGLTPFLKNKPGVKINGLDLLALQAVKTLEFWTGKRFTVREIGRLRNIVLVTAPTQVLAV